MKKKTIYVVSFLLILCLIPPTSAVYGDVSPESITSISETLPDDTLFYPDALGSLAGDGNTTGSSGGTYASTQASDNVNWYVETTITGSTYNSTFHLEFEPVIGEAPQTNLHVEYFFNRSSGTGTFDDGGIQIYNYTANSWEYLYNDADWHGSEVSRMLSINGSGWLNSQGVLTLRATLELTDGGGSTDFGLYLDFFHIETMTLVDSDHYAESFTDVSDWVLSVGNGISSDGDLGSFDVAGDFNYDTYYDNSPSLSAVSMYVEVRAKTNVSGSDFLVRLYASDSLGGSNTIVHSLGSMSTTMTTYKALFSGSHVVECVALMARHNSAFDIEVDYLRVGPANETGWQHDGSTTIGVTEYIGSVSSDGDLITISGEVGTGIFFFDDTDTIAKSEDTYYPFVSITVTTVEAGATWNLGYATTDTPSVWGDFFWWIVDETTTGTFRLNLAFFDVDPSNIAVLTQDGAVTVDYIKRYSIANFTYAINSDDEGDYYYTESGVLERVIDESDESGMLKYDPVMSVDTEIYTGWAITTDYALGGKHFVFRPYLPIELREIFQDQISGGFLIETTMTQFWLYMYETGSISAIRFIDTRDWQGVATVTFIFPIGWDPVFQFGFDAFFIFAGLIMIPLSTMYLVRGGRDELSMDKLFYGLIIFVIGFGLLVGGIMP